MSSFIYFYSKFTEEFLLLGGAGIFTMLSAYCYHWVIKRRRLGAARSQVPSSVVKAYLNQLINEAQFVRTQLFGLLGGEVDPNGIQNLLHRPHFDNAGAAGADPSAASFSSETAVNAAPAANFSGSVPTDLLERLKSLEGQLAQKESLVVNVNVEKTRLLEEIENLKQNQKALQNSSAVSAGQEELLKKIKNLEERLEEYALFEDDLANLKRLQQENTSLKKRLEDSGAPAASLSAGAAEPVVETLIPASQPEALEKTIVPADKNGKQVSLDKNTIDTLLEGVSPLPTKAPDAAKDEPAVEPVVQAAKADDFEKLVDSVENSLSKDKQPPAPVEKTAKAAPALAAVPTPTATEPAKATAPEATKATAAAAPEAAKAAASATTAAEPTKAAPAPAAKAETTAKAADAAPVAAAPATSEKSDEELLKEFENLLNS